MEQDVNSIAHVNMTLSVTTAPESATVDLGGLGTTVTKVVF